MTVLTDQFLHENMSGMPARSVHGNASLGSLIPMTFHTGLPWRLRSMRLRGFSIRREHELNKQSVLLDQAETVAVLTDDIAMCAQLPGCISLPHEMTAIAKILAFLDVIVESEGKNDAQCRNNEQKRDKYPFFLGAQPLFQFVYYFVNEFEHER
jgi:hypothetical protein